MDPLAAFVPGQLIAEERASSLMGMLGPALFVAISLATQPTAPPPGSTTERVVCPSDPAQTYTLYLPPQYDRSRRWPLLLVFDPRGRGSQAAELFRDAAATYGWIIVSSDNTRSDGPWEPNARALAALWPHVLQAYAVDSRRVYAAGFSGGATVAWVLARSTGAIAGIIATGAPAEQELDPSGARFAWFGSAGRADFNFLDARALEARMLKAGVPHRLEFFDGAHQWMSPDVARMAVSWLEVLAMKTGLRPRDEAMVARLLTEETARVAELERAGDVTDARRVLSAMIETYEGLLDVAAVRTRLAALDVDARFERARKKEQHWDDWERARRVAAGKVVARLRDDEPPYAGEIVERLNIASLQKTAQKTDYEGGAARRVLEAIFVQTAFYVPRNLEVGREYSRSAISLEVATAIHPERPMVWLNLAAARAMTSSKKGAIAALRKAIELGFKDRELLASDERFAALRTTPEYVALIQALGGE